MVGQERLGYVVTEDSKLRFGKAATSRSFYRAECLGQPGGELTTFMRILEVARHGQPLGASKGRGTSSFIVLAFALFLVALGSLFSLWSFRSVVPGV